MRKAFDTINIHTLISKLLQTKIPGTSIKFIVNYIYGRKAYTTYTNYTYPKNACMSLAVHSLYSKRWINNYMSASPLYDGHSSQWYVVMWLKSWNTKINSTYWCTHYEFKDLMWSKNTSGYFSFYVNNMWIKIKFPLNPN